MNTKYYVPSGQIPRHDVVHASGFHFGQIMTNNLNSEPYEMSMSSYGETLGRQVEHCTNERCKIRRNVKKTILIQHSTQVRKNVYKRRLATYKRD